MLKLLNAVGNVRVESRRGDFAGMSESLLWRFAASRGFFEAVDENPSCSST